MAHLLIGIAIADHEDGVTVIDGPLHEEQRAKLLEFSTASDQPDLRAGLFGSS